MMTDTIEDGPSAHTAKVAPLWHTLLLAMAVLFVSALGLRMKAHAAALKTHHVREYLFTAAWEWALAGAVLWGLRLGRMPLSQLLGEWKQERKAWLGDAGAALVFWVASALVLAFVGALLRMMHLRLPEGTVAALAPGNAAELLLFLLLSVSAGFCEELLFRGYFQEQFSYLARGHVSGGIAASSLLFGFAHLYEGAAGVISITVFGAMFSLLARKRRSLRPGMLAHAWHDGLSGLVLFSLRHWHMLS